jgi:hypothetical protein
MKELATVDLEALDTLKAQLEKLRPIIEHARPSAVHTQHAQYNNLNVVKHYYTMVQTYLKLLDNIENLAWAERQIINK